MYIILHTEPFDKELSKYFSPEEQRQVEHFEKRQLINNPYVGDPLCYKFFREKKVGGKRVYFLIYDDLNVVLMVLTSDKKTQQEKINEIKLHLEDYYFLVKETIRQLA